MRNRPLRRPIPRTLTLLALLASIPTACAQPRTQPTSSPAYDQLDVTDLQQHIGELFGDPNAATATYWYGRPTLAELFYYPQTLAPTDDDRETVRRFLAGEFQARRNFAWRDLGVPPSWSDNPFNNNTYDLYRHSLNWLPPVVAVGLVDQDARAFALVQTVVRDWLKHNAKPPGASPCAWNDHATSYRLRLFVWLFEQLRAHHALDDDFARVLLAAIVQHAAYCADPTHYSMRSNHALHVNSSLLAASASFPNCVYASHWRRAAYDGLTAYMRVNFSAGGFNLEQSPSYHWYVLENIDRVAGFARANNLRDPGGFDQVLQQAVAVWPWLVRTSGSLPNIGDTGIAAYPDWQDRLRGLAPEEIGVRAPSTLPNPRTDKAGFLLDPDVGYAIFTGYSIGTPQPANDTHVLFRCNTWRHTGHCHQDGQSFEIYSLGRLWLVDSGCFNYEKRTAARQYFISPRAHNVVLVDGATHAWEPMTVFSHERTATHDRVVARMTLPQAVHTRSFSYAPPYSFVIADTLRSTDDTPHSYEQLFQVAPDLTVRVVSPTEVHLTAPDGARCVIRQTGTVGTWSSITGQDEPFVQGWYSSSYNRRVPCPTLFYRTTAPVADCDFETHIDLYPAPPTTTQTAATD